MYNNQHDRLSFPDYIVKSFGNASLLIAKKHASIKSKSAN